jgi:Transglutaminase-like superfamily
MNKKVLSFITAFLLFFSVTLSAQGGNDRFKVVDEYVQSLGRLDTLNAGTISHILTKKFAENTDKVRAIFYWIANNISIDVKMAKKGSNEKMVSEDVLKTRKANANGYSTLFQDMCSVAKIRCLTVDGYIKKTVEDINNVPDEFNHTWAVIQLGQSPDAWYYVDPEWGSGYVDDKGTTFTKKFDDRYFFANKLLFNLQHFPDNMAWQLGNTGPKSAKDFFAQPIVKRDAVEFNVSSFLPAEGFIKANIKKAVVFNLKVPANTKIDIVALQIGTDKKSRTKTVDYTIKNGVVSFSYKFDEEDSYPVTVLINNKPVLGYFAEISE